MSTTTQSHVVDRLRRIGRGKVFTPKDFLDVGSREAVDQVMSRLAKAGIVVRLRRGLYYYPRVNRRLGVQVPPDLDAIAEALARQTGSRIAPSGATAANKLGLSTQVPAKPVYLTDGRSRQVRVGNYMVTVKHVAPKDLPAGSPKTVAVLQALRHLGKDAVDTQVIDRIRRALPVKDRARLAAESRYTTDWIGEAMRRIAGTEDRVGADG